MGSSGGASSASSGGVLMPPASVLTSASDTVWPGVNFAIFNRVTIPAASTWRYVNFRIGTSSGNIQVGVVRLSGTSRLDYTLVMDSGVIAAPTAGAQRIDCGATTLEAGDYAVFVWADNTTITVPHATSSPLVPSRMSNSVGALASGVPASGTLPAWGSTRYVSGLAVEADV